MIRLKRLQIEEFRGIRSIDLALNSKPFVVYGPNGSGKSGVVDAIDFALTGSIARLTGAGTAGVTIQRHGPHVHRRDDPAAAKVSLTVEDAESGEVATIVRSVKNPISFSLKPDTPAMREALQEALEHPELTLSRRELIKFIVAKPGDRAAEVQALLKLDRVESIRRSLKSALSKATSEAKGAKGEKDTAEQAFQQHLGITTLMGTEVLREINQRRRTLGLDALDELSADSDLLRGAPERNRSGTLSSEGAVRDVAALMKVIGNPETLDDSRSTVRAALDALAANPGTIDAVKHHGLLELGLAALVNDTCPLCEKQWETPEALRGHIEQRITETQRAHQMREAVESAAAAYASELRQLRGLVESSMPAVNLYGGEELPVQLKHMSESLLGAEKMSANFDVVMAAHDELRKAFYVPPSEVVTGLRVLRDVLENLPDDSEEAAAQSFLDVAKDRWIRVRLARAKSTQSDLVRRAAEAAYNAYHSAADEALAALYATVERDFSRYYQFVNSDDEGTFRAELTPSAGSLELKVDFYTLGMFPPIAYHSEGHQDGMGICLYLALVKQLLGEKFTFAVLDDVVMSVDSNHRRRFAELLQAEFSGVQFVITTHDEVWARQMRSAGLVKTASMARFFGWSVDAGPTFGSGNTWSAIDADMESGDIAGAAHKLRRALEANAADITESLGGSVVYRSDGSYDLSAFLDAVKGRHAKLLSMAAASAQTWKNSEQAKQVEYLKIRRGEVLPEHDGESWLVNKVVHNNDWANATEADLRPVISAAREFLSLFQCENPDCDSWISVGWNKGSEESLRCACQAYNLNLRKK